MRWTRSWVRGLIGVLVGGMTIVLGATSSVGVAGADDVDGSGTVVVNSSTDAPSTEPGDGECETAPGNGICTLRAAVQEANASPGVHTIVLPAGTYELVIDGPGPGGDQAARGDLDILADVKIEGAGSEVTIIDAGATDDQGTRLFRDRIFQVHPEASLTLVGVTVTRGLKASADDAEWEGGAILNLGAIDLTDVRVTDSVVVEDGVSAVRGGGGIANRGGVAELRDVVIDGNSVQATPLSGTTKYGGGILNADGGTLVVIDSQIRSNSTQNGAGIYNAADSTAVLEDSVVADNQATPGGTGGGIRNAGSLTLSGSTVADNFGHFSGGGIHGSGVLIASRVEGNDAQRGGGLYGSFDLTETIVRDNSANLGAGIEGSGVIVDSTIADNRARNGGGGIQVGTDSKISLVRSTVSGNGAISTSALTPAEGGGIRNVLGTVELINSTVSGNFLDHDDPFGFPPNDPLRGGGIYNGIGHVVIQNSTIADNTAEEGSAIYFNGPGGSLSLERSIIASDVPDNCEGAGTFTSLGHNLEDANSCGLFSVGDLRDTDPRIESLANVGGPTHTHALKDDSPAISAGGTDCPPPTTDQRGVPRPQGAACDIGAYEAEQTPGSGSPSYLPLTPTRILDTRDHAGGPIGSPAQPVGAGESRAVTVTGVGGVPESGVGAVVVNVTAVNATTNTFVTVYPSGSERPDASTFNPRPGGVIANEIIAPVGDDGQVQVYNHNGEVDVLFDVVGWLPEEADYTPLSPTRILDTRDHAGGPIGSPAQPVGAGESRAVTVTGVGGVPADGVGAVVVNVTAVNATTATFVTVYPSGEPRPDASTFNPRPGGVIANEIIAPVGDDGQVQVYNHNGEVDILFDVVGWLPDEVEALAVVTQELSAFTVGLRGADGLRAEGGVPPYGWELTDGDLPAGLELRPDGAATGIPTAEAASSTVTVTVTDDADRTAYTLSLHDALPIDRKSVV